ncbi:conserved Plasmodium protein, unknown function [Plasmodium reichenowi]|uniref:RING-type domain-containing protein n=2 Tax=Plasmodium reichenowi TaxID=5854 RepID=A0A060RY97_PLARE|nr:conserved Plasmodium protein, unknown function [Plasmodium reichenowi]
MEHSENIKKRYVNHSDMKLEKFKKAAYEVIEYKDKIIRMLCAILEVQGITTVNIKEYISSNNEPSLDSFLDNNQYESKGYKKKTSSRKRTLINVPDFRTLKKNKELNLFSNPDKMNEELIKEKNFSDSVLSSYRMSLDDKKLQNKMIDNILFRDISGGKKRTFVEEVEDNEDKNNKSAQKYIDGNDKNFIESRKKALENFQQNENNYDCTYKTIKKKNISGCNTTSKLKDLNNSEECQLCLMPNSDSLHGNFPPTFYKLTCDHIFHLMCLYETVIRRECRKTCCICHNELSENDKNEIINKVKLEKKENEKKSKLLFKVMKLQAENKDYPRKDICS